MALIDHIDGPNRDIYLSATTVGNSFHPIDLYKEMRVLRRNDEELRKQDIYMSGHGSESKGGGKFTERYVKLLGGTRLIPYDTSHELTITGTIITDEGTEGIACFDRTSLSPSTVVDINYVPPQVEVIQVSVGSAVTEQDKKDIASQVWNEDLSLHVEEGTSGNNLSGVSLDAKSILAIEEGTWKIEGTQMIFKDKEGIELFRTSLFNSKGQPSNEDVFERRRVI